MSVLADVPDRIRRRPFEFYPGIWVSAYPDAVTAIPPDCDVIVNLCRTPDHDYVSPVPVLYRPFAYWLVQPDPVEKLHEIAAEVWQLATDGYTPLVHCRLGLDRSGLVALALLRDEDDAAVLDRYLDAAEPAPTDQVLGLYATYCTRKDPIRRAR